MKKSAPKVILLFTFFSKISPCNKFGNGKLHNAVGNNRSCERYFEHTLRCLLGGRVKDFKTSLDKNQMDVKIRRFIC